MLHRTCVALLLLLSACATMEPGPGEWEAPNPRFANLQRAAQYPWTDDGHCVVREASNEWPVLAERCFHALEHDRVKFRDVTGKCAVASAGAAAVGVGLCVFAAPGIVAGAVIVIGVVVVAVAIKEELDAYERSAARERARPKTQARPSTRQEPSANRKPKREPTPEESAEPFIPPIPAPEEKDGWNERCRDHYVRCKHSPEGERWGRKFSESQCQACWDLCRRTGQWPDEAHGKPCPGGQP
jgi:hypothetical protein